MRMADVCRQGRECMIRADGNECALYFVFSLCNEHGVRKSVYCRAAVVVHGVLSPTEHISVRFLAIRPRCLSRSTTVVSREQNALYRVCGPLRNTEPAHTQFHGDPP